MPDTGALSGKFAVIYFGTTDGASDIYAGAKLKNWKVSSTIQLATDNDCSQLDTYTAPVGRTTTISFEKLVASSPEVAAKFFDTDPSALVVYFELYAGRGLGATAGTGTKRYEGMATFKDFGNEVDGNALERENGSLEMSGALE